MFEKETKKNTRLPRNFHKTFVPERRFINALLKFAARGEAGGIQEIAQATGIPTGKSSGKVSPTLDYCRGMGLLILRAGDKSVKKPELTAFGRVVLLEDPYLKTEITQWIAHLNLCREEGGAEAWFQTFWNGSVRLGPVFERSDLENWLASSCKTKSGGLIGPLVNMYQEEASFAQCKALKEEGKKLHRRVMPVRSDFTWGYAAWILSAMERAASRGDQVTIPQLEKASGWSVLTGWSLAEAERVLLLVEQKGVLSVDRQMDPWILKSKIPSIEAWRFFYKDMI